MFAFVVYAVLVWLAAARWRRQWESFAWIAASLVGLALIAYLHYLLDIWTDGEVCLPVLQSLLFPYTALVGIVGLFIACLPAGPRPPVCPICDYDMVGLDMDDKTVCPECGVNFALARAGLVRHRPTYIAPNPQRRVTRAKPARQRRRPGPPPVVLKWPPS